MKHAITVVGFAIAMVASPTSACRSPAATLAVIQSDLPAPLTNDLVAIEVEFPETLTSSDFRRSGAEVPVLRVIRGDVPAAEIWISPAGGQSSCHYAFSNGHRGIVVGHLRSAGDRVVLEPIWVARRNGFRISPSPTD